MAAAWNGGGLLDLANPAVARRQLDSDVVDVGIGVGYICVLLAEDTVLCTGDGSRGQFGVEMEYAAEWLEIALP